MAYRTQSISAFNTDAHVYLTFKETGVLSTDTVESNGRKGRLGGERENFFFFLSLPPYHDRYHRSCRPQDRDTISLSPRTRVMPRRNDSALSCIRSHHSLLDVGVTSLYTPSCLTPEFAIRIMGPRGCIFLTS